MIHTERQRMKQTDINIDRGVNKICKIRRYQRNNIDVNICIYN